MIKYNELIEDRKNYSLQLIDFLDTGIIECDVKLPLSFYEKYSNIFKYSLDYIKVFKNIDIWDYFNKNAYLGDESYQKASEILDMHYSIEEQLEESLYFYNMINVEDSDIKYFIFNLIKVLELLIEIYPHNKEIYIKALNECKEACNFIKKISSIKYDKEKTKYKKVYLPDSWFILPDGNLYNTGNGHKGTSLIYDLDRVKNYISNNISLNGITNKFDEIKKETAKNGFTYSQFKEYLNYRYNTIYPDKEHEFPTSHNKQILNHILNVIDAKTYFYYFFENLEKYTLNSKEEFEKIMKFTKNDIVDIFVRCCGFHKVESILDKTITTSCITYKEELAEYIKRGWKIYFIPPIIIQKDIGQISELNIESLFVKRYIYRR